MDKKPLLVAITVMAVIGCFVFFLLPKGGYDGEYAHGEAHIQDPSGKYAYEEASIEEASIPDECAGLANEAQKASCYVLKATTQEDPQYCQKLANADNIQTCIAGATHDAAPCLKVQNEYIKKECSDPVHMYWALKNNDPTRCEQIFDEYSAQECKRALGAVSTASDCGYDDDCFTAYGKRYPSACEAIEDKGNREACLLGAAAATKDATYCNSITTDYLKEDCIEAAFGPGNPAICNQYSDQSEKDGCYETLAREANDPSICGRISDNDDKESCYWSVATRNNNIKGCDMIAAQYTRKDCYESIAFDETVPEACAIFEDVEDRDECYFNTAEKTKNDSACASISSSSGRDDCYYNVADETWESGPCAYIVDLPLKARCIEENTFE